MQKNATWSQIPDGIVSRFEQNSIMYRVGYSKKGNWQNTLRTYNKDNVPAAIKETIEYAFDGYAITLVDEITTRDGLAYIVHIENKEWMRQIKITKNDVVDLETFEIKKP